ncbi:YicC/YloC family endoribonuclease [Rhodohalobacter sp.]|uniref:YicC/YloC family endoribonuclease n=1 Tax=Rhodohalobacter sp. TaxID=1974210 RepID=UPI002ACD2954|nr:YicC/YloC family endoribonuclease [Rhodohalobacter sp.]MDZ7757782.1 YicC/YloC family endoribonuclease [Rhodohalobacter sp.]
MITSMTGFGRGEHSSNGYQVTVEVKTLNSRYLDISVRMPQSIQDKEIKLKEYVQKHLSRGKVNLNINVDRTKSAGPDIKLNEELVKSYSSILRNLRSAGNIDEPVTVRDLLQFNDIFETRKQDEEEVRIIWECTENALETALDNLNTMRQNEGQELKEDLSNLVTGIISLLDEVIVLSDKRAPEVREKLKTRIQKMISEEQIDPDRMEMEIALLVDKMDINEEVIRLQSHLKFFLEALEAEEPVGRRLNFLCQEINRELNTIGSKANDSTVAHHIVLGKEKLEQVREQVQNIE